MLLCFKQGFQKELFLVSAERYDPEQDEEDDYQRVSALNCTKVVFMQFCVAWVDVLLVFLGLRCFIDINRG